jgi:hypothetical protein
MNAIGYAANWFSRLPDSITAVLRIWSVKALSLMIRACLRHLSFDEHFAIVQEGEEQRRLSLAQLPLPALWAGDSPSKTWLQAAQRLAYMPEEALANATLGLHQWARSLLMGLLVQTEAAREVLFAHSPVLVLIRQSQCPPRQRLAAFLPPLYCALERFCRRGYLDPTIFVRECWALWQFRAVPPLFQTQWSPEECQEAELAYQKEKPIAAIIAANERLDVTPPDEFLLELSHWLVRSHEVQEEQGATAEPIKRGKKRKREELTLWKASDAHH